MKKNILIIFMIFPVYVEAGICDWFKNIYTREFETCPYERVSRKLTCVQHGIDSGKSIIRIAKPRRPDSEYHIKKGAEDFGIAYEFPLKDMDISIIYTHKWNGGENNKVWLAQKSTISKLRSGEITSPSLAQILDHSYKFSDTYVDSYLYDGRYYFVKNIVDGFVSEGVFEATKIYALEAYLIKPDLTTEKICRAEF